MAQQTESIAGVPDGAVGRPARAEASALERGQLRSTPGFWRRAWNRYRRNALSMVALWMCIAIVLFVAAAPLISRYVTGFTYAENHLAQKLTPVMTDGYILGADGNGRDVLTRLAYGGRVSLLFALLAAFTTLVIGGLLGSVAGFFGGWIDTAAMRLVDILLSLPTLSLLILISSLYQPGPIYLALFIASVSWAGVARLVRAEVLSLRGRDFVEAARVTGATNARIISKHIIPNVVPTIVVWLSLVIPGLILTEAVLSYLGLGVRVPTPSWGNMLQEAKQFLRQSWTLIFIPGFIIYLTVLAINLVGIGLRDALDPRLNE